jgi:hypothetical protein
LYHDHSTQHTAHSTQHTAHSTFSIVKRFLQSLFSGKLKIHFGQYGEDILIHKIFSKRIRYGFYLDVGAFHPFQYSNTAYLWVKGWRGMNVDANPNSIRIFKKARSQDTNLLAAIVPAETAKNNASVPIYSSGSNIDPMGTCDQKTAGDRGYAEMHNIPAYDISAILEMAAKISGGVIDFLNIDIEGLDEIIVNEIDFNKYKPSVVCIEDYSSDIPTCAVSNITRRLLLAGYSLDAKIGPSSIFQLASFRMN